MPNILKRQRKPAISSSVSSAAFRHHYDYYAAGANAVEACSYQATEAAFARKGIEKAEASRLIRLSGELVREAKNDVLLEHPEWDPADLLTAGIRA